jgi:uncharacterized protein YbjT (DUF2867 family)
MILVTGATGTVGRPLVDLLAGEGAKVRAVTRDPRAAGLPAGVEVVTGDPSRPATIASLLEGVTSLFLHPRAAGEAAGDLLALARERGVERVVVLSAINVDDDPAEQPSRFQGDRNKEAEEAAVASGLTWVSLRAASFAANTLRTWAPQVRAGDVVRGPYATFAEPLIDERDLAEVGARALLDGEPAGRKLRLTGPRSLSHEELVAEIGTVIGRPLRYQEVPPEAFAQGMIQRGLPQPFVEALMARYARGAGPAETVTGDVEEILGRPARTYAEWVAGHAAAFRRVPPRGDDEHLAPHGGRGSRRLPGARRFLLHHRRRPLRPGARPAPGRALRAVTRSAGEEVAKGSRDVGGGLLGHEVTVIDGGVPYAGRPGAPERLRVEAQGGAPVLLEHGDRHPQPVAGVPVGLIVGHVDAGGGTVVGDDRGYGSA